MGSRVRVTQAAPASLALGQAVVFTTLYRNLERACDGAAGIYRPSGVMGCRRGQTAGRYRDSGSRGGGRQCPPGRSDADDEGRGRNFVRARNFEFAVLRNR